MSAGTRNSGLFAQVIHVPVIVPLAEHVPGSAEQPTMSGWLCLAAFLLVFPGWYAASCVWFPFKDCGLCAGSGSHRSKGNARNSRPCWWCRGRGKKLRYGRRIWNFVQRRRKAARGG